MALRLIRGGAQHPLGRFRSITTRDATGLSHDGEVYYAWNALPSSGEPQYEIQFGDGTWMLCSGNELEGGHFTCAQISPLSLPAVMIRRTSIGLANPVVAKSTVERLLAAASIQYEWHCETATLVGNGLRLRPQPNGLYELVDLGWIFETVETVGL